MARRSEAKSEEKPKAAAATRAGNNDRAIKAAIEEELAGDVAKISIIKLVDLLMEYAYFARASDVHIEPESGRIRVRLRIDGVMHDAFVFPKELQSEIITRIKVLSGLRTDEHQAAQDGRFKAPVRDVGYFDVRVSIAPTYYGENAVLRVLAEQAQAFTLESLGFEGAELEKIKRAIKKPYGMILATGPTGSGKTTTLYTIIKILNTPEVSIITVEDPIEYSIEGIDQIQVNARTGITFASGLRSILRQDPNIIMVGEIRDEETAAIAVNAALTGHLLLSTLHTNNAATSLPRLIDMKVEPFLIASTVNVVIGQRLLRRICDDCKMQVDITDEELATIKQVVRTELLAGQKKFFKGKGCASCDDSGYKSRIGVHEVLEIDDEIREAIMRRANTAEIQKIAIKNGMRPMLEDAFQKAVAGATTIEEIVRVVHE
ncbi:MAG: type II/IV secretion system protein [Candidatus Harrisonbacteria bacterium]|nr:type II/IV secretion system protein [Candidatus Harrisonbacteria bacterium]